MLKNILKKSKNNKGYGIIEMILYVAIFAVLSIAVINSMITMTKSFKETAINADLLSGGNIMERLSREIREAKSVSALVSPDDIKIENTDGSFSEFKLSQQNINYLKNDVLSGNLNSSNVAVTALSFTKNNTPVSDSVKIVLTVQSLRAQDVRTENFYDTVVLRGKY